MSKIIKNTYLSLFIVIFALLSGCQTKNAHKNWPDSLPDQSIFASAYHKQVADGTNNATLNNHLLWIKRFYLGSIIYPIGWNDMIDMLGASLQGTELEPREPEARKRLQDLGLTISIEWARSNKSRKIDSSNIATWGNSLRTSVKRQQQFEFLDKVEKDVADLMSGKLNKTQINRDRYYPPEDYDNF